MIQSLKFRWRWFQLGVLYGCSDSFELRHLRIAGKRITLRWPEGEEKLHEWEFGKIFIDDCYGLRSIRHPVRSVADIGGNTGVFSMVCRHLFRDAVIHSYEPNPGLQASQTNHLNPLGVQVHPEGVGATNGGMAFSQGVNSLMSVGNRIDDGDVPITSIHDVVARLNGGVDLLKVDCEGAEWEILEQLDPLGKVRSLRMEYHLWARPGSTHADIDRLVTNTGLSVTRHDFEPADDFGLVWATRPQ